MEGRLWQITFAVIGGLWLLAESSTSAQVAPPTAYVVDAWTVEQGLPQNSVTAISQTPDGYLWLGTLGGLARFDGSRFATFDRARTDGLESNRILVLHVDRQGTLWIGTEGGGLSRYDGSRFTSFTQAQGLPSGSILSIAEDHEGTLWIGTEGGGLARLDDSRFTVFTTRDGLAGNTVQALYADRQGTLWIGTEGGGLSRYDGSRFTSFTQAQGLPSGSILSIAEDHEGTLWIGTEGGGLARLSQGTLTPFEDRTGLPAGTVQYVPTLLTDEEGDLWIGTFRGLFRFRDGSTELFQDGLPRTNVTALYEDREGSLWVGTDRGLRRLKDAIFNVYTEADGLAGDVALAVYQDRSGALWIGTSCEGLSRLQDSTFRTYREQDGLGNACVWSIHEDRAGALWIGTRGGLTRLQNDRFTTYTMQDGLPDAFVRAIHEDRTGALWIGTRGGLTRLQNGRFTTYTTAEGLVNNRVRYILQGKDGALWIATAGGLSRLQDGAFQSYTTREGLSSDDVRSLYEDKDGVLWIGTYDGGLCRLRDGRLTAYTTQEGMADDRVSVILEDDHGHLWMGGNRGVQRVNKQSLHAFAAGEIDRLPVTLYGRDAGLKNSECSGGFQPAGWKARDGRLWFPTIEGVAYADPSHLNLDMPPPPVLIEEILTDGGPIEKREGRAAPPRGARDLEIRFTSTSLLAPERIRFRFMLNDLDERWIEAGSRRTAYYRNVPPGAYTFRTAASYDGVTWGEAASLPIYIAPFFYETRWFLALCAAALLAIGLVAYQRRTRHLEVRARKLHRMVEERTSALKAAKEQTEAALRKAEHEHALAQDALSTVEEQAIHLLRMDHLKNRFFSNISHEFRTPLTLIIDPLENALQGGFGPLDDTFKQRIQVALRNARLLLRLINQLLDLAKIEAGGMALHASEENVIPFLQSTVQVFNSEAERLKITLLFTPEQARLMLYFDREKLEKVLLNLISNALKATPAGGKVLVSIREMKAEDTGAGFAEITVRDTGIGIPPEQLPLIFDRFYQVEGPSSRRRAGTGIGLSLVKELVELHRGEIDVESVPGFGSIFTVRLPLGRSHLAEHEITDQPPPAPQPLPEDYVADAGVLEARLAPAEENAATAQAAGAERPLVLVVEDNPDVRALLCGHLAAAYRVAEAENGLQGVEKARALHPDLVISDVVMPEMEGIAFCRQLKQDPRLRDIPVILLTARASEESRLAGLQVGADDYLTKPFSKQELLTRAENLIRSRRALRDQFSQEVVIRPSGIVVSSAEATFLGRVREVVERHLEDPGFTVGALAAETGLSESQLKRRLRAAVDQTPVELIRNLRLDRAAQLLRQHAGNVSEVAFAVGFQNLPYFAKCFRERFGVPPSQYLTRNTSGGGQPNAG